MQKLICIRCGRRRDADRLTTGEFRNRIGPLCIAQPTCRNRAQAARKAAREQANGPNR